MTLRNKSADRIFVFLSPDKHHFVDRLERLHKRHSSPITLISPKTLQTADRRPTVGRHIGR